MRSVSLEYIDKFAISRSQGGKAITELSGLAIEPAATGEPSGGFHIWTLDDEKRNLYRLDAAAVLTEKVELPKAMGENLEGIAFVPGGNGAPDRLVAVQENVGDKGPALVVVDRDGSHARQILLSDIDGYGSVIDPSDDTATPLSRYAEGAPESAGLEGIAWCDKPGEEAFYLLKEKSPGLLIELAPDFSRLRSMRVLNIGDYSGPRPRHTPFADFATDPVMALDFSGIAYDTRRDRLWISGDQDRASYLFDMQSNRFEQFSLDTGYEEIEKPEGIAWLAGKNGDNDRLIIANDHENESETFLHFFKIIDADLFDEG